MTEPDRSRRDAAAAAEAAGLSPLANDEPLEDDEGPEASTVDSGGGPNDAGDPAPDRSQEDERP
jgi:hypothetical protein